MPSKSAMVAAAIAGTTKAESTPALKIASIASLRALSQDALCERARKSGDTLASHQIELGKVVFILDETRPEKVVLKKHVRKTLGVELEPAPYKVASAFRMVGEGHGTVTEKQFDACQLRWLFIISAILNLMAKNAGKPEEMPAEEVAAIREQVAKAIRDRSKDTGKVLKLIYDTLRPEKEKVTGKRKKAKCRPTGSRTFAPCGITSRRAKGKVPQTWVCSRRCSKHSVRTPRRKSRRSMPRCLRSRPPKWRKLRNPARAGGLEQSRPSALFFLDHRFSARPP